MKGVDFVFHLAAMVSVQGSMQKPNECAEINAASYSDCFGRGDAGASEKADLQQLGCDLRRLAYPAILRAIRNGWT